MNDAQDHEKYAELCALSTSGALSPHESLQLRYHLAVCPDCRQAYREYCVLASEVIPSLAQAYEAPGNLADWDNSKVRSRLLAGLDRETIAPSALQSKPLQRPRFVFLAAVAACLLAAVGIAAYQTGMHKGIRSPFAPPGPVAQMRSPQIEKQSLESQLRDSLTAMSALQQKSAKEQAEADKLQSRIHEMDARISELNALDRLKEERAQSLVSERDALVQQLRDAQENYRTVEDELGRYRSQQRDALVHTASLESEIKRLSNQVSEQDQAIRDREDYLASDRDIRELMGARHLYIADVYDIDKNGQPRSSFGRVFYTVDKSLVFYAFDLDQGATLKNATFQAWGRKDLGGEKPVSLGIFYMDSAANRRWVLRTNDAAKIAQINSIFVTAEPGGGSQKPSGKPFLFASLRQPPNHP
jgi:hypothetical protein